MAYSQPPWPAKQLVVSAGGASMVFDKSTLQSLNADEAALLDHFYRSTITPLFYVECLADLSKTMTGNSTADQLVRSLAARTPDWNSTANVHHMSVLQSELARGFDLRQVRFRPSPGVPELVQLGDQKGMIFRQAPEDQAMMRWAEGDFLTTERQFAKQWRNALTAIDFKAMAQDVMKSIGGHWRTPKSLEDAKTMADAIIDFMEPEWLLRFGLDLLGAAEATEFVVQEWAFNRRPPIRQHMPYFIFMLSINLFFCLVLPTQLLSNVKASHQIDLAYLYYLPFCAIFTSRDNFHVNVVPLFLATGQTFIHGDDLKADLKKLNAFYSALPEEIQRKGLSGFARHPPDDTAFLVTQMWDKYMPGWRSMPPPKDVDDPAYDSKKTLEELKRLTDSPDVVPHTETDIDKISYVKVERTIRLSKGRYSRFSEETNLRIREDADR